MIDSLPAPYFGGEGADCQETAVLMQPDLLIEIEIIVAANFLPCNQRQMQLIKREVEHLRMGLVFSFEILQ
ncbi:MAG: hypothetical protein GY805_38415 [Chloroflexi bacterium]|nr:hypothetical protein [Chloroflexota bacterium]